MEELNALLVIVLVWIYFALIIVCSRWAMNDAHQRNRNPFFVWFAVVICFPFGWLAWLIFRPEKSVKRKNSYVMSDSGAFLRLVLLGRKTLAINRNMMIERLSFYVLLSIDLWRASNRLKG